MDEQACLNEEEEINSTANGIHCPTVWDGLTCWNSVPAGVTSSSKCPSFKGFDVTKEVYRSCGSTGEWLDRNSLPSSKGWTNYTYCVTPEILEVIRRLGSKDDAQIKFNIAANTRILEFVGLSLSLFSLCISLLIFYYFRTLRNSRTRIHRHLFLAMVIQVAIRLTLYTDQAITRSAQTSGNTSTEVSNKTHVSRGIDNTPVLCEASYISLEYARTAMFLWMFVEGLFLHNMITVTVFEERLSPLVYPMIGWIIPIPLTVTWAIVTHLHYGSATCWWGYNFTVYFWILEGPRLAVLLVNLLFLLNILRVLVMKLRQSNSTETHQALKAVKAALVLLPLLGLTNLLNMVDAPLEKSPFQFALWSYTTHLLTSTQGFILAFLYCFTNGEVQTTLRKFVRVRVSGAVSSRMASVRSTHSKRRKVRLSARNQTMLNHTRSPSPPPTQLIVRSYGTGFTRHTTTVAGNSFPRDLHDEDMQENRQPLLSRCSSNEVSASPTIKPLTPPSNNVPERCSQGRPGVTRDELRTGECSNRELNMFSWRVLRMPKFFMRNKREEEAVEGEISLPQTARQCDAEKVNKIYYDLKESKEEIDFESVETNRSSSFGSPHFLVGGNNGTVGNTMDRGENKPHIVITVTTI